MYSEPNLTTSRCVCISDKGAELYLILYEIDLLLYRNEAGVKIPITNFKFSKPIESLSYLRIFQDFFLF